jgi:hypothetical protein
MKEMLKINSQSSPSVALQIMIGKVFKAIIRKIAPDGGGSPEGFGLKNTGDAAGVGLFLKNIETGQVTQIPETSIMENLPAVVSFVVPAHLPEGEYRLSVVSQFSPGSKNLKVPRAYVFAAPLKCNRDKAGINKQESPAG